MEAFHTGDFFIFICCLEFIGIGQYVEFSTGVFIWCFFRDVYGVGGVHLFPHQGDQEAGLQDG
jgi:hypothetical protein